MAINKGNIKTSVNYNLEAQKPLDARSVRPTKADLYKKKSWEYDEDTVYIHEGQITYTEQEKKLFVLKDVENFEKEEAWARILTTDDDIPSGGGSDITVDTAMSDSSTNPVQNRVVKKYVDDAISNIPPQEPAVDVVDGLDSTDTNAALSANQGRILNEKIEAVANEATKIFNVKGSCKYSELPSANNAVGDVYNITDSFTIGSETYPAGTNVVWDGNNWDALGGSIDLSGYATAETVVAMVQEETDRARGAETRIQNDIKTIKSDVAKKVDKEDGKGLSEEDFTSALKKKLNELVNYDDSALQTKVNSLQNQLNALTDDSGLEEVIAKYEELKAFLEGLGNDEYGAFIEEISSQIATLEAELGNTNKRIDSVVESLEDLASEIVIDEKEVYIGAEQPADAKIWIDTDEDYPEGGGGTGGGGLEYLEFNSPTTANESMNIISTIHRKYSATGKMPVAWINENGARSLISQIMYENDGNGMLASRSMDSEVLYMVTSGVLLVIRSSLVMKLDATASDTNKMVATLLRAVSFTQWQIFNIPIYLEIDGAMYEAVSKSKESDGTVYGQFMVGNKLKIYKLTHSQNGVYVPLLMSEITLGGGGVTEEKVGEMIAASIGDIKASIVAINGEEV